MALTEADAHADATGMPRPDTPTLGVELGLGVARGDAHIPGEVCGGPCRQPLEAGEPYTLVGDTVTCLGCAATGGA